MCIAVVVPAGIKLPPREQIRIMWRNNADGAGLCYPAVDGKIQIVKGFDNPDEFIAFLEQQFPNWKATNNLFLHFRIGTHGAIVPEHTHPFPIGASLDAMEQLCSSVDVAVMHNGVMYEWGDDLSMSDTMAFAQNFLGALKLEHPGSRGIIEDAIGAWNKIAIMHHDRYELYGKGWINDGGRIYSNAGYKPVARGYCDPRKQVPVGVEAEPLPELKSIYEMTDAEFEREFGL